MASAQRHITRKVMTTHVRFTTNLQYLGVPQALIEKCLKIRIGDDTRPIWFRVSLLKNNGLRMILYPSEVCVKKDRPFKGWKSNGNARRYYISAIAILHNLAHRGITLSKLNFKTEIEPGKITCVLPPYLKQRE